MLQPNTTASILTRHPINHTYSAQQSIAIASPMLRITVRKHRRCTSQPKIIGDIITSNIHRECLHEHIGNIADVSATFLTLVYLTECSPTVECCSALFGDISPMVLNDEKTGENFNACIGTFIDVPMPW